MNVDEWLRWVCLALAVLGAIGAAVWIGWHLRGKRAARDALETVEKWRQAERFKLQANGRTSARRPEHDGEEASRVSRIRVTGEKPAPPIRPRTRL